MTGHAGFWYRIRLALCCALLANSCNLLCLAPLAIVGWTPGPGFHVASDARISLTFSAEPDSVSAEGAFSLVCDGEPVAGYFEWDGMLMSYVPLGPLAANAEYRLTIGADVRTSRGCSMEHAFEVRFTTRPEYDRPWVVATNPEAFGSLSTPDGSVVVQFSEALDRGAFGAALDFVPPISGDWHLDETGSVAIFRPRNSWQPGLTYRLDISPDLIDASGNRMGRDYSTEFTCGSDHVAPVLVSVGAVDADGVDVMAFDLDDPRDFIITSNHGVETSWSMRLHFSEPVSLRTLASRLVCDGGPALTLATAGEASDIAVFNFEQRPSFGSCLVVRALPGIQDVAGNATIDEVVWRMSMDGPASAPPRLLGVRLPLTPGAEETGDRQLVSFGIDQPFRTIALTGEPEGYPVGVPTMVTIELYLDIAAGAALDRLAIMQSFGITATNGAIEFQPLRVELGGFESVPPCEPWSSCAVTRVSGALTNRASSGVVTISLAAGLHDSLGNTMARPQSLPLLK